MKKQLLLSMMFVMVFVLSTLAQRTVTGTVTDEEGDPLPGVSVVIKGTATGTTTNLDGVYRLSIDEGATLVFSYVGFANQEVAVGARAVIDVKLSGATELEEVVVTALGINKSAASLGYGVAKIGGDELKGRQQSDIARLLRGKATGVDINQTSGLSGSGTNIIIRGYSTITGSNQPLFVVDGIPFNTASNTGNQNFTTGSATASSRFLDLDPNNVEDITILKGLSATVLYGEAGKNGVILVTTKAGKGGVDANKKMEISVNQGVYASQIANLPDYQNTFGNGFSGGFGWFFSNWGAAFDDLRPSTYESAYQGEENGEVLITHPYDQAQYNDDVPEYIGVKYPFRAYESVENFFQTGITSNTSLSIQSRVNENVSMSATYSYLTEDGFTPRLDNKYEGHDRSNFLDKHNFGLGARTKLANGLKIKASFNFVRSDRLTPITAPAFGGGGNGLFAAILFTPRSLDLNGIPYQSPIDGSNIYYRRGSAIQNPRWTLNNAGQSEKVDRFFSSTELSYDLTDNLILLYRLSLDEYTQLNRRFVNKGGPRQPLGELSTFTSGSKVSDQIFNLIYDFKLSESFTIDGIVGFNNRREIGTGTGVFSSNQFIYNLFTHDNFIDNNSFSFRSEENIIGVYATSTIGYKYYLFLNLQARNDWTSTLEPVNQSVLYPSASLSFLPTDAFSSLANNNILNYLKLRVGVGLSAGYPDPYATRSTLGSSTRDFVTTSGAVINRNSVANFLGSSELNRELYTEYEAGVEGRFWNNNINVNLSLYQKISSDLIINLPLDPATGYEVTTVNAAKIENKGIELGIDFKVPIPGSVSWDITWNYTRNISSVDEIYPGIEQVEIDGFSVLDDVAIPGNVAIPGQPYGIMWGETFLRVTDKDSEHFGKYIVDSQGAYQSSGNFGNIGDPNPDYQMNWINNISYKGISFGFQFQFIKGGDIFSSTVQALLARGNTVDTDVPRDIPIIMPNSVKDVGDGTYVENDIQTYLGDTYFRGYFFADDGGIFDATVLRLRQISLSYALPKSVVDNTPFGNIGISVSGENLWYNAPNFPEGTNFDPEISSLGVGNGRGFDFRTAPTAKKYGVNLNLTF